MLVIRRSWLWRYTVATIFSLLVGTHLWGQDLLPVPALSSHVIDTSGTLSQAQLQMLDAKLSTFEAASGAQVVVLMIPTTQPEDIASYANRVGSAWKIGRKDFGDGLLLVVAKDDRKLRIEVARALEGAVPDLVAKRVIDQAISPRFKQGDFAGGIDAGLEQIMALIRGEALPAPEASTANKQAGFQWMDLAVFLFFAVAIGGTIVRRILGNKLGSMAMGGIAGTVAMVITSSIAIAVLAAIVAAVFTLVSSMRQFAQGGSRHGGGFGGGSGGGWSSGGGGGGFSSGGGGGFGGGGASGGW